MQQSRFYLAALFAILLASTGRAYNRPGCPGWPSQDEWETDLREKLSDPSLLHGPFFRHPTKIYVQECLHDEDLSDHNVLSKGKGLCMHRHACANEQCQIVERSNIPAYTVEAVSVEDIQAAIRFANKYDVAISVKSSGHSYQGQSMQADSLLVWLRNFPITNDITENFVDTGKNNHGPTISVVAGENFDNVLEGVKDKYTVVTGECRTVCLSGGWLLGGGLSSLSRYYGYGVDQAVSFQVVLADASVVTADAFTNPDLFWALRGGGGGNFGIVTKVEYKLHPVAPVTLLEFNFYNGIPFLENLHKQTRRMIREWVTFFVRNLPTTETRWSGGYVTPTGAELTFLGGLKDARSSDFIVSMDKWYDNLIKSGFDPGFKRPSDNLVEYSSIYDAKGGAEAFEKPDFQTNTMPPILGTPISRLIPMQAAVERTDELIDLIVWIGVHGKLFPIYFLAGNAADVAKNATAIHPGMRDAVFCITLTTDWANKEILKFAGDQVAEWSVSYNHHNVLEDDWPNVLWGSNYPRLLEIKRKYDPTHRLNVWHGVDYKSRKERHNCGRNGYKNLFYLIPYYGAFMLQLFQGEIANY